MNGSSIVDYMLLSSDYFGNVQHFSIGDQTELSHFLFEASLHVKVKTDRVTQNERQNHTKFIKYKYIFSDTTINKSRHSLKTQVNNVETCDVLGLIYNEEEITDVING